MGPGFLSSTLLRCFSSSLLIEEFQIQKFPQKTGSDERRVAPRSPAKGSQETVPGRRSQAGSVVKEPPLVIQEFSRTQVGRISRKQYLTLTRQSNCLHGRGSRMALVSWSSVRSVIPGWQRWPASQPRSILGSGSQHHRWGNPDSQSQIHPHGGGIWLATQATGR